MTTMTSESNMGQYHNLANGSILSNQQNPRHIHQQQAPPPLMTSMGQGYATTSPPTSATSSVTGSSPVLILGNIPSDLTKREATILFSLVIDELINIDLKDYKIYAYFKNINTCLTTGKLLEGKFIFGAEYPPLTVEYENAASLNITSPQNLPTTFNSLRLGSTSNISPPHLNHQLNHPNSNSQLQNMQQTSSQPASNQSQQANFDNYQKRQSIGNQRSRFVFSDPFSGATTPTSAGPTNSSNPAHTGPPPSSSGAPPQSGVIDLAEFSGKSILMMESQNDAREYESLVRDPWNSTQSSAPGATIGPLSSGPQTPGVNNHAPFDWNNNNSSTTNQPASGNPNSNSNGSSGGAANSADRRRTSSAFFNNPPLHPLTTTSQQLGGHSSVSAPQGPTAAGLLGSQQPQPNQAQSLVQKQTTNGMTSMTTLASSGKTQPPPTTIATSLQSMSSTAQKLSPPQQHQQPQLSSASQSAANIGQPSTSRQSSSTNIKDVPDLSLLARVPPPANPADQNPPCNTLYVGNLPPDATEAELRALFAPQKGFRRLSFRTKNQSSSGGPSSANSHNHGPMCFVEFEDVAHATRALAELYGRALPRPNGSNGKGGIRLSFSKNPLGVRGPGNPRRTSTNQIPGVGASGSVTAVPTSSVSQGTLNSQNNAGGVGNYGYLNYHQK